MIPSAPEREAQLDAYARKHGQDAAEALDDMPADYLAREAEELEQTMVALREGLEDMEAGRTRSASEVLEELRLKHGFPG